MAGMQDVRVGLDAGAVALKVVVTDQEGRILAQRYARTQGRPVETAEKVLREVLAEAGVGAGGVELIAGTGSAGRMLCEVLGAPFINEVIAQATAIRRLEPAVRTLVEIGGQDTKLIFLPESAEDRRPLLDFVMNTNCAAGTGSFLDQQASRLGINIEGEFGALAVQSQTPPRVAGRCSVFAKSDMIHLQQLATPVHDIVAGLCLGLARNLKSNLAGGRELPVPIAFCGGVAANLGVARALEEVFGLADGALVIPVQHAFTGALGAIWAAERERTRLGETHGRPEGGRVRVEMLQDHAAQSAAGGKLLRPLGELEMNGANHAPEQVRQDAGRDGHGDQSTAIDAWLGLDVGSISTKIAVIDRANRVLAKIYLMTAGRPLDAVRNVLKEIGSQIAALPYAVNIRGAATTGSGRYLTGDIIGADLVINEITAQATAAAALDPEVDTIFEIGGQDSKYIALDRGVVVDFEMNHACAAGTGSFLEEQAERLGVSIKGQFAELAFASRTPIRLGERCTVFMESDLLSHMQRGAPTKDLVSGLCYSIVSNYINRVVGHRKIGHRIFFQGGTAFNRGVVAAFQAVTGRPITVPTNHEVTGAIGAAVLARQHMAKLAAERGEAVSRFAGFDAADVKYEVRSFECEHCANLCEINEVRVPGREPLYYGSRCDRYNTRKNQAAPSAMPDLFAERHRMLVKHANLPGGKANGTKKTVGVPLALLNYQLLPFWGTLLTELGLHVVLSPPSTGALIHRGVEATLSTPCFPIKVAHGHVLDLLEKKVDYIFLPSLLSLKKEFAENRFNEPCPYVTAFPYTMAAALQAAGVGAHHAKVLTPKVRLERGPKEAVRGLKELCREVGVSAGRLTAAVEKAWAAQTAFEDACKARGREVLATLPEDVRPVVVISRPYNGCDKAVSLDLAGKLRKLNVLALPMDFLDLATDEPTRDRVFECMYWKYGQRILHAAKLVRAHPRLHAIYMSNFSCGPDSFLISFFKRIMTPKPSLVLEIDEHSADAGVVTRLEAFLESLRYAATRGPLPPALPLYPSESNGNGNGHAHGNGKARTLYVPWMSDQSHAVAAGMRAFGVDARVLPMADEGAIELGRRHCTGKECLPCIITAGDMLKVTKEPGFDPKSAAFFMPRSCGPCRFGQYASLHKLILAENGLPDVPIIDPSDDSTFYDAMADGVGQSTRLSWNAICMADVLGRALVACRPYEAEPGTTVALYRDLLERLCRLIETRPSEKRIAAFAAEAAAAFAPLAARRPTQMRDRKPLIGVIGENYVRLHDVANNHLIRQLEALGAETTVASFGEYLLYTNWTRMNQAVRERTPRLWLTNVVQDEVQRRIARRINKPFHRFLGHIDEPRTRAFVERARFCIDPAFEAGEAVLCVAKTMELHEHGAHGVVSVMPFGCMPTTILAGLTKTIAARTGSMPMLHVAYDGQQDPTLQTRLEAFLYQARTYQSGLTGTQHAATTPAS